MGPDSQVDLQKKDDTVTADSFVMGMALDGSKLFHCVPPQLRGIWSRDSSTEKQKVPRCGEKMHGVPATGGQQ